MPISIAGQASPIALPCRPGACVPGTRKATADPAVLPLQDKTEGTFDQFRALEAKIELIVGRNGIFLDRQGRDGETTNVKLVSHPISIGEAFWTPYRHLAHRNLKAGLPPSLGLHALAPGTRGFGQAGVEHRRRWAFCFFGSYARICADETVVVICSDHGWVGSIPRRLPSPI